MLLCALCRCSGAGLVAVCGASILLPVIELSLDKSVLGPWLFDTVRLLVFRPKLSCCLVWFCFLRPYYCDRSRQWLCRPELQIEQGTLSRFLEPSLERYSTHSDCEVLSLCAINTARRYETSLAVALVDIAVLLLLMHDYHGCRLLDWLPHLLFFS